MNRSANAARDHAGRAREVGDGPSVRHVLVHPSKRAGEGRITQARQQPPRLRRRFCGPKAQRFDEQNLDEPLQDQVTPRATRGGLFNR